jgi:signal peptide peptidase SppA
LTQNSFFLAELHREPWAMEQGAYEAFVAKVSDALQAARFASRPMPTAAPRPLSIEADGTALIYITGTLMKDVPWWFKYESIPATAYGDIEKDLQAALASPDVKRIQLVVDSPGGQSSGLKRVADSLFAAREQKPITARVEDMSASAAYWLTCQASEISAGPLAALGSIGTYLVIPNFERLAKNIGIEVEVFRTGSLKGAGVPGTALTPEQRGFYQELVDTLTQGFVADVARGRGVSVAKVQEWTSGRVWIGKEAMALGLCDTLESNLELSGRSAARTADYRVSNVSHEEEAMPPKSATTEEPVIPPAPAAPKAATIAELKAAFPGESDFVLAQAEKNAPMADAKAAFADVVIERNKALKAENEALKAKAAAPAPVAPRKDVAADTAGVVPLEQADPGSGAAPKEDFLTKAKALAESKKIPLFQACSELARKEPELHAAYVEHCRTNRKEINRRKPEGWEAKD